jgi:hypothetical protein
MILVLFFMFMAILSLPLQLVLMAAMKKSRPEIENEIEKTVYGKGSLGKYKAMLEGMEGHASGKWFMRGVVLERWLRILSFIGFVFVILMGYLFVSR